MPTLATQPPNVVDSRLAFSADFNLNCVACKTYGYDLGYLSLPIEYQTGLTLGDVRSHEHLDICIDACLQVKIFDRDEQVYQVPANMFSRPYEAPNSRSNESAIFIHQCCKSFLVRNFPQRELGGAIQYNGLATDI